MGSKPYSNSRWWDNPMPVDSLCNNCKYYQGYLNCGKRKSKIQRDILDKSFPGTEKFDENYCQYREEK